jgi:hypothetical protein
MSVTREVVIRCDRRDCSAEVSLPTRSTQKARKVAGEAGWWFGLTKPGAMRVDLCPECCKQFMDGMGPE